MDKVLVIAGQTSTGKTRMALELAKITPLEIISCDSRQAVIGNDILVGKDIPKNSRFKLVTKLKNANIGYYDFEATKVWLYDMVTSEKYMSVALWCECARLVIKDILNRKKLPVIVGGSMMYIWAFVNNFTDVEAPRDNGLRLEAENLKPDELFARLQADFPDWAAKLNTSDRQNPRRLVRMIERAKYHLIHDSRLKMQEYDFKKIGLYADMEYLTKLLSQRINERARSLSSIDKALWLKSEIAIAKKQKNWISKLPDFQWYNIANDPASRDLI